MEMEILETLLNWGFILVGGFLIIIIVIRAFSDYYYEDDPLTIPKGMMAIILVSGVLLLSYMRLRGKIDEGKEKEQLEMNIISENGGVITLTNGQEVPGIFIQKGDGFFERKTETLYYKDKILAVKINEN